MIKDDIPELPLADTGELLVRRDCYSVRQDERYRWLQEGKSIQSIMDRNKPDQLVLPTQHAMFCAIPAVKGASNILNLGCGLGAIERKLASDFSQIRCVSVDASMQVFELATEYFSLPHNHNFILSNAEQYLRKTKTFFDIVMVDLFTNESNALCVYDLEFYENIASCLLANGVVSMNLIPKDQNDLLRILLPLRTHFPNVWFLEIVGRSNIVLLGSKNYSFDLQGAIKDCAHESHKYGFEPVILAREFVQLPNVSP